MVRDRTRGRMVARRTSPEIGAFCERYKSELGKLRGAIDLVAGGPPCQGFSFAGKRNRRDPRNALFQHYLDVLDLIRPPLVLLENVPGIDIAFGKTRPQARKAASYAKVIREALEDRGYSVSARLVRAVDFGVAQQRPRYLLVGVSRDGQIKLPLADPFELLFKIRRPFLKSKHLSHKRLVTVQEAISDLEIAGKPLVPCAESPGFTQINYEGPRNGYQRLLHGSTNGFAPNSLRLTKHRPNTQRRFKRILQTCRKGVQLSSSDRLRIGFSKRVIVPLAPDRPSHTLTTLPDDLVHYSEPRILTVREYARLQSFPDWFTFSGSYTTGGLRRRQECPRYTQVGNAVAPLPGGGLGSFPGDPSRNLHATGNHRQPRRERHQAAHLAAIKQAPAV